MTLTAMLFTSCAVKQETVGAALQIAAVESAAKLKPDQKKKAAAVLRTVAKQINAVADDKGVVNADDIAKAFRVAQTVELDENTKRWATEAAILIDSQWPAGVTVPADKARVLAKQLTAAAASLE